MNGIKLPVWLAKLVAAMGGGGLFIAAFLDSSVLSFPLVQDALVIELSLLRPSRMPYYATMAALGSLAGCIWLYWLAKKGGEAYFRRHTRGAAERIKRWVQSNAFLTAFAPAILPPPCPFKPFILAEGVFQVPLRTFVTALLLGRGLRYFGEGYLAVRYGEAATPFLKAHKWELALVAVGLVVLSYVVSRAMFRASPTDK